MFPPLFDQDLCFAQAVENIAVEQCFTHPSVETFAIYVFPVEPLLNVGNLRAGSSDPALSGLCNELGATVQPDECGSAAQY